MSEFPLAPDLTLNNFRDFVVSSRFAEVSDAEWRKKYAGFIEGEQLEFLMQHGNGAMLLYGDHMGINRSTAPDELRYHMADEMGDSLWFVFDIADRADLTIEECVKHSLNRFVSEAEVHTIKNFAELEALATAHADDISVTNKMGVYGIPGIRHETSLEDDPFYVITRTVARLSRSLDVHKFDSIAGPRTTTSLEAVTELDQALGDYLLALAYIATNRLGVPIEQVAKFNMEKLRHRRIYGKENDIQFTEAYNKIK